MISLRQDDYIAVQAHVVCHRNLLRNSISLETKVNMVEKELADTVKKFRTLKARLDEYEAQKLNKKLNITYVLDLRIIRGY